MSTAVAQPNIALIKYWGKQDEKLIIPATSSISLTLSGFPTTTTVTLNPETDHDRVTLNGQSIPPEGTGRMRRLLSWVRELAGSQQHAHVTSTNTIATAAGLASSAAGFAALAKAATMAYGVEISDRELSTIARLGSGSAARSVYGGMVRWNRGYDHDSSYAEPLQWKGQPLAFVIVQISGAKKQVSSGQGMTQTITTSPFYEGWVTSNQELVQQAESAIEHGDLARLGELTELSTMRMHASMLGAHPPLRYLSGESFTVLDAVTELRTQGHPVWATADAGPNIKILTTAQECEQVYHAICERFGHLTIFTSAIGQGVYSTSG